MQPEQHPAFDLIEEARFARRMLGVLDTSLAKIIDAGAALPVRAPMEPAKPARLEVPTVNPDGWTDEVLALVRSGRAMGATPQEIAGEVFAMFGLSVTPHVLLAAVMHFDLDRRDAAPAPTELQAVQEQEQQEQPAEPVADQPCDASPVVAHEAAPVIDEAPPAAAEPVQDGPDQTVRERENARLRELWEAGTAYREIAAIMKREGFKPRSVNGWIGRAHRIGLSRPAQEAARTAAAKIATKPAAWEAEAIRLYAAGCGMNPYAISKQLGVPDYAVRKAVIRGYGTSDGRQAAQAVANRPAPSLPPVSIPKPQPHEPETKPQPAPAPARRAVAKPAADPLPWSPPARTSNGCNTEIPAPGKGLHVTALQVDHCRWLMGPGADGHETYCGCRKSRHGSYYCDAHAKRAFNVWPPAKPLKRPTRMARALSALPDARNRQPERTV